MVICAQGADSWWMKVRFMLEFGEVLYNHNYSKAEGRQLVQWAVDVLLQEHEQVDEAGKTCLGVIVTQGTRNWTIPVKQNVEHYTLGYI